jgi:hypothetical protein
MYVIRRSNPAQDWMSQRPVESLAADPVSEGIDGRSVPAAGSTP